MNPLVSVIIPTYNRKDCIDSAISSIYRQSYESIEIIVWDNGDDDSHTLKEKYPAVSWFRSRENFGVCKATNMGVLVSFGEYILLMDNDCMLLGGDAISKLVYFLDTHKNAVAVCPYHVHNSMNTKSLFSEKTARAFVKNYYNIDDPYKTQRVGVFYGTTALIRKSYWEQYGGFDNRYFAYGQENELSAKLTKCGKEIWYYPEAKAYHHLDLKSRSSDNMIYYCLRNMTWFYVKYLPLHLMIPNLVKWWTIFLIRGIRNPKNLMRSIRDTLSGLKSMIIERDVIKDEYGLKTYRISRIVYDFKILLTMVASCIKKRLL